MAKGWIKIHREIMEWQWYGFPLHRALFLHLLVKCNFKDTKVGAKVFKPGQLFTNKRDLARETGISYSSIRRILDDLVMSNDVGTLRQRRGVVISITNWDKYQLADNLKGTHKGTHEGTLVGTSYNKKEKKEKNKKNKSGKPDDAFILVEEIIEYFNSKRGTNYSANAFETKKLLTQAIKKGMSKNDIISAIDYANETAYSDPELQKYFRPSTVFQIKKLSRFIDEASQEGKSNNNLIQYLDDIVERKN